MEVAVIVAGGSGTRMRSEIPKQFLRLAGRPILMHTIEAFRNYSKKIKIIVVLPADWKEEWGHLIDKYQFNISHQVVEGGDTRTESVKNGIVYVDDNDIVAIHDGVRPFVSKSVISKAFGTASSEGNASVSVRLKESLRTMAPDGKSRAVNRDDFRLIQTPQVFKGNIIKSAYKKIESVSREFTDDASVIEYCGYTVNLVEGDYLNIKITTPEDLRMGESVIEIIDSIPSGSERG